MKGSPMSDEITKLKQKLTKLEFKLNVKTLDLKECKAKLAEQKSKLAEQKLKFNEYKTTHKAKILKSKEEYVTSIDVAPHWKKTQERLAHVKRPCNTP